MEHKGVSLQSFSLLTLLFLSFWSIWSTEHCSCLNCVHLQYGNWYDHWSGIENWNGAMPSTIMTQRIGWQKLHIFPTVLQCYLVWHWVISTWSFQDVNTPTDNSKTIFMRKTVSVYLNLWRMQSCDVDTKFNFPLQSRSEKQYFTSVSVTVLVY